MIRNLFAKPRTYLGILLIITIAVRFINLGKPSLRFDEGASWYIAQNTSIQELVHGDFFLEGNVPAFYLLVKILPFGNEFFVRGISAITGVASLIICYLLFRTFGTRRIAILSSVLLSISPALVYYSREFRSYMPGFFMQVTSLIFFFLAFKKNGRETLFAYLCLLSTFVALFTTLSSSYIVIFYFSWLIINRPDKTHSRLTIVFYSILAILMAFLATWLLRYTASSYGQIALSNYVAVRNRNILASTITTLKELTFFYPHWIGPKVNYLAVQSGVATLFLVITAMYISKKKSNLPSILLDMLLLFVTTLGTAIVFSIIAFDVMSMKLLLILCVPFAYIISFLTITSKGKSKWQLIINPFVAVCAIFLFNIYFNAHAKQYDFRQIYTRVSDNIASSRCTYLVISQEAAIGLIAYYDKLLDTHLASKTTFFPINYNDSDQPTRQINDLIQIDRNKQCDGLLYLQHYDYWDKQSPSHNTFTAFLSNFNHTHTFQQDIDPRRLTLSVFQRKK